MSSTAIRGCLVVGDPTATNVAVPCWCRSAVPGYPPQPRGSAPGGRAAQAAFRFFRSSVAPASRPAGLLARRPPGFRHLGTPRRLSFQPSPGSTRRCRIALSSARRREAASATQFWGSLLALTPSVALWAPRAPAYNGHLHEAPGHADTQRPCRRGQPGAVAACYLRPVLEGVPAPQHALAARRRAPGHREMLLLRRRHVGGYLPARGSVERPVWRGVDLIFLTATWGLCVSSCREAVTGRVGAQRAASARGFHVIPTAGSSPRARPASPRVIRL